MLPVAMEEVFVNNVGFPRQTGEVENEATGTGWMLTV